MAPASSRHGGDAVIDEVRSTLASLRAGAGRRRQRRRLEAGGDDIRIHPSVEIRSPSRLTLGSEVVVDCGVVLHCGGMPWSGYAGGISIGSKSYIGPNSVLFGAGCIEIGESVLVAPGVVITSQEHQQGHRADMRDQPVELDRIVIERNVWIGANATILPGVRLGHGSIVGAGAVVTQNVPAMTVVLGVPARVARER